MICFKNLEDMAFTLVDKVVDTYTENQVRSWVNHKTDEDGFAALHFASFRGNVSVIELLLKHGADMYVRNNFGINVLHVAAQGD